MLTYCSRALNDRAAPSNGGYYTLVPISVCHVILNLNLKISIRISRQKMFTFYVYMYYCREKKNVFYLSMILLQCCAVTVIGFLNILVSCNNVWNIQCNGSILYEFVNILVMHCFVPTAFPLNIK